MQRTCVKCGHVHPNASYSDAEACPRCGAIYSKVRSLADGGAAIRPVVVPTDAQRLAAVAQRGAAAAQASLQADDQVRMAAAAHVKGIQAADTQWPTVPANLRAHAGKVLVTTTAFVPGRDITGICGVVAHDTAHAFGAVFEEFAGFLRNVVGSGGSPATSKLLRESRAEVMAGLQVQALALGADAVIDVRFDYEEFSGANGHGVLVVVGTGTAVALAPPMQSAISPLVRTQ